MESFNNAKSSVLGGVGGIWGKINNSDNIAMKVLKVAIIIFVLKYIIDTVISLYLNYRKQSKSSPWLLNGVKSAKKRMILLQDPKKPGSVTLQRSENEYGGLEFSYAFWAHIDDWSYKYGQWKHILHKGNDTSWPLRCPGIWLHPKKNAMRVYVNTFKNVGEYGDVDNIPLNKWFHVAVAVKQRNMDIFINGNIAKRVELEGLPKQNSGDVYISGFRGFSGFLSNIKYYDFYITIPEIDKLIKFGPAQGACIDSNETAPPYLSQNYWANQK